jgi:hypothetical protein
MLAHRAKRNSLQQVDARCVYGLAMMFPYLQPKGLVDYGQHAAIPLKFQTPLQCRSCVLVTDPLTAGADHRRSYWNALGVPQTS